MNKNTLSLMLIVSAVFFACLSALSAFMYGFIEWLWKFSGFLSLVSLIAYVIVDFANVKANLSKKRLSLE
jgi:membrane protein implicated in regulation of membrane protease activity